MTVADRRAIELRPATGDDEPLVFRLFCIERAPQFARLGLPPAELGQLLRVQFEARERQYRGEFPGADFDIVLHNAQPVGYCYAERGPDAFVIIDLAVLPGHRRQGIASAVVNELIGRAKAAKKPLSAHVLLDNPAWNLWRKLGFIDLGDDGVYRRIEVPADDAET